MSYRQVDAGRGIAWITEAAELLLRNPTPFLLMGLVVSLALAVPVLGGLALSVFGQALNGGVIHAAREQAAGRPADFKHLFQAFSEPEKLPKMLLLCLPGLAAGTLIGVLAVVLIGGALVAAGVSTAVDSDAMAALSLGSGGLMFIAIATALGLAAYALVFFATPRVMLEKQEPFEAMKESWAAALANAMPIITFVFALTLAAVLVSVVIGMLSATLAQIAVVTVAFPLAATAMWLGCRDVFGGPAASGDSLPPPPPSIEA